MAPTPEQAKELIKRYEPILYMHPDEAFVPVNPKVYVENSALWHSQPSSDNKLDWGNRVSAGDFPRSPLIPKTGISVNPSDDGSSDTDGDGVKETYLGQRKDGRLPYLYSDRERELFFDFAGWSDTQVVDATTLNKAPNRERAISRYENEPLLKESRFWYYAEVDNLETLTNMIALVNQSKGVDLGVIWDYLTSTAHIIWYYFFYPYHEEVTRHCGDSIGAATDASYEGDWAAVAVIVRDPFGSAVEEPEYVGFSRRLRGLPEGVMEKLPSVEEFIKGLSQLMDVNRWSVTARQGRHIKVYVARRSHNNYKVEMPKDPPGSSVTNFGCETTAKVTEEVEKKLDELNETMDTVKDTAIAVGKMAAGCGIGALFGGWLGCGIGAVVGGIAGLIEGAVNDSDGSSAPVDDRANQESERDYPPDVDKYGTVISPADLLAALPEQPPKSKQITPWAGKPEEKLVDRAQQIWWPGKGDQAGYNGRWGVRVQEDPLDRRSGITFPKFKQAFLMGLAKLMSEEISE